MLYANNYQPNIQTGQEMSVHALRVLAPRTKYDELNKVYTLKAQKRIE